MSASPPVACGNSLVIKNTNPHRHSSRFFDLLSPPVGCNSGFLCIRVISLQCVFSVVCRPVSPICVNMISQERLEGIQVWHKSPRGLKNELRSRIQVRGHKNTCIWHFMFNRLTTFFWLIIKEQKGKLESYFSVIIQLFLIQGWT